MKSDKYGQMAHGAIRILLFLTCLVFGVDSSRAQSPTILWERFAWAPTHPLTGFQTQDLSGEDWAYDVKLSFSSSGVHDGYIFAGYTTFPRYTFSSSTGFQCGGGFLAKGCATPKLYKTDIHGRVEWYRTYSENEGQFFNVIQTSDGGYLAVGRAREKGSGIRYLSPSNRVTGITLDPLVLPLQRHIYVVKTDAQGSLEWEFLYGIPGNPQADPEYASDGWDVVEMPDGRARIVGCAADPSDGFSPFTIKALMLQIDARPSSSTRGKLEWLRTYCDPSKASMATALTRAGNHYFVTGAQFQHSDRLNSAGNIFLMKFGSSSSTPIFKKLVTAQSSRHDFSYDVEVDTGGRILISGVEGCSDCFRSSARGSGDAKLYALSQFGHPLFTTDLGTVKGFDLWVTLAATFDGGSAVVSTKQIGSPLPSLVSDELQGDDLAYTNTNAFVAKVDSAGRIEWSIADHDASTPFGLFPLDEKRQECLYSIVETPGRDYLISGNSSSNYDDDYFVKLEGPAPDLRLGLSNGGLNPTLDWTPLPGAQSYRIYLRTQGTWHLWTVINHPSVTEFTDPDVVDCSNQFAWFYYCDQGASAQAIDYRVSGIDSSGQESLFSNVMSLEGAFLF